VTYEPTCPICGESVADYKGPCPKPDKPTICVDEPTIDKLRRGEAVEINAVTLLPADDLRK